MSYNIEKIYPDNLKLRQKGNVANLGEQWQRACMESESARCFCDRRIFVLSMPEIYLIQSLFSRKR